jgi:hypothetical protein
MDSSKQCCLHVIKAENGELIQFSDRCWKCCLEYIDKWKKLDDICKDIADKFSTLTDIIISNAEQRTVGYHFNCYKNVRTTYSSKRPRNACHKSILHSQSAGQIDTQTSYVPSKKITHQSSA